MTDIILDDGFKITELSVSTFQRHDPNGLFESRYNPETKKMDNTTVLESIRKSEYKAYRDDIALISTREEKGDEWDREGKTIRRRQYMVYPKPDGQPKGSGWRFLTYDQQEWCRQENARILDAISKEPDFKRYFNW